MREIIHTVWKSSSNMALAVIPPLWTTRSCSKYRVGTEYRDTFKKCIVILFWGIAQHYYRPTHPCPQLIWSARVVIRRPRVFETTVTRSRLLWDRLLSTEELRRSIFSRFYPWFVIPLCWCHYKEIAYYYNLKLFHEISIWNGRFQVRKLMNLRIYF
jgi:hypothetical protein